MAGLKLFLLGPPRVELNSTPVDIQRRKAVALLAYLAVTGQAHSRDALATFFWPELDQQRGRAYLRRDLAALNTSLSGNWLIADRETVELNREAGPWLDTEHFQRLLIASHEHGHAPEIVCTECVSFLTEAAVLYTGDFLAGFTLRDSPEFDDWQFFQTESLRQELATTLERLVRGLNAQGKAEAAIPYARRWVALDPLHEPAQRQLIQVYDQAGQPAAGLRQYEEYVKLLEQELGLPPEEETTTLYEAIKAKRLLGSFIKAEEQKRSGQTRRRDKRAAEPVAAPSEAVLPVSTFAPVRLSPPKLPDSSTGEINRLIGREAELGQLSACLEQALAGSRQLVFITGEAGLGKTTLVETFLAETRAKTTLWIGRGQCIEHHGAGEAYMPMLEAWGRMCREPGGQVLITLLARVAPTWLAQMPWLISPEDFELLQSRILATTRERMLREMAEAIETLTAEQPLVLLLEDLHWSDYSTLDLLTWLARRQEPARLLLIGTYRPSDVKLQDHPLQAVVQDIQLRDQGLEVALPLLTPAMVETYLWRRFPGASLPAELAHLLHQRTSGSPLFIRTLSDSWVTHGALVEVDGQWVLRAKLEALMVGVPDTLRQLIEQQFRQLDPTHQTILEVASVAGVEFATATLMAGVDLPEEEIERRCVALVQQGLFLQAGDIVEWPDGVVAAQFRFSHYLYQEVLYERVPAGRQVRLHRQIGQRLETGYGVSAPEKAVELGLHFVRGRDPERAVRYLHFAAEQAMQRNAYREAIEHLTQALEFLQRYPEVPERTQYELTLQSALGSALIMTRGWSAPEAEQAFIRAGELCRRLEKFGQLSSVLYSLATLYELRGEYSKSQALLEERLQLPHDPQDYRSQLESYELLACTAFHQGAFTQALSYANQALNFCNPQDMALTALLGENPAISSQHWAGLALWFLGYPDQALARSQQALNQARELAYMFSLAHAHVQAALLHQLRQEEQEVYQQAETTMTAAIQGGFAFWLGVGQILHGWAVAVQGQAEWGLVQLRQGLDTCQATGVTIDQPYFLYLLADACGRTGRLEEGMAALTEAFALARQSRAFFHEAELHRLQGELLLQLDPQKNLAAAEATFQQALAIARRQQAKLLELRVTISLSRLWQKQGQVNQARSMLAEVYNWFSEGFDTTDLREAKTLLEELGGKVKPSSHRGRGEEKASPVPLLRPDLEQQVRYCRAPDNVRLAYATVGHGPPLVKTANWLSHLEYDWQSPVWRHWLEGLARHHTLVRYDKRGCGLSDWEVNDFSLRAQVDDLETVVNALGLKNFPLLGLSGGSAVALAYAVRHPEQVSHLILYGGYVRGRLKRSESLEQFEEIQMLLKVMELGWGKANPAFRQVYTGLFIPEGTAEQFHWFNELQRISTAPEIAMRMATASYSVDVSDLAAQVTVPTLVLHARDDAVVPFEQSCQLATLIPGARFVPLESKNHILLEHEPAWPQFLAEVHQFLGVAQEEQLVPPASPKSQISSAPAVTSISPQGPRFVARQQELIQLDAFLEAALSGDHRVVFVTGEAGQGKSALLQAFARRAQIAHSDLVCASGTCNAYTGIGDPYLPFREILELLTGAVEAQTAAGMLPTGQAERLRHLWPHSIKALVREGPHLLDTFIPAQLLLSRAVAAPGGTAWLDELQALVNLKLKHPDSPAVQQAALFEQYLKVVQDLSRQTPLLLLLDDLQWADRGSINLLFHLGRRLAGHRILIVGAYRPAEVAIGRDGERHPLEFVVNEFQRHFGDISLNLAQAEGEAFVNALLDSEPNRFNDSFRSTLFQLTEGHPLFTIELLRGMQERGDLIRDEAGRWVEEPGLDWQKLPARVEGAIGERISRLAQPLRELLQAASVEGEEFTAEVVARVLGADSHRVVRQLSGELDKRHQLIQAQGLKQEGTLRLSRYRFRHILIQRYLYHSLDEVERVHLNEAIGNAFEALYAEQTDQIAIQLAWHYQEAGILEKAVYYLLQAGRRASRLSANEEAIAHLRQSLTLLKLLPDTPERARQELDVQIALGPVLVAARGYSVPEVKQTYSRARELIRHGQETPELFWVLIGLWGFYLVRAELQTTRELGEQALVLARRLKDPVLLVEAHRVLGMTLFHLGEFALAREQLEQGAHLYDPQQHRSLAFLSVADPGVTCLAYLARTLWHLGFPNQALEKIYQALDLAQDLAHPFSLAAARVYTARVHQCCRDAQATLEQAEAAIALSTEQGFPHYISMGTILQGWATAQQGNVETGITQIRDGLTVGDSTQIRIARTHFLAMLAEAYGQAGQVEEGLKVLAEALASIGQSFERQWQAELYRLKGELLLVAKNGDHNEAEVSTPEDCFLKALTLARQQGSKALELRTALSLGRLWHAQRSSNKSDEARRLLEEAYGWFIEGFETADLQEAKTLLEELGSEIKLRSKVETPPAPPLSRLSTPLPFGSDPTSPSTSQHFVQKTLIARGGMGEVYRGQDITTGQPVAIKRLKPELVAHHPEAVQRLIREGEILRQLNHPNIVKVLATLENEGEPIIVMEYIPGGSLKDLLDWQPQLPLERALHIGLELADALARVHHRGILHRDLKPANVLLAEDDTPRLTDFGVAYLAQTENKLTQEGAILGTTAYLSPEAWRGEPLDARSDIWSFGAMLYEMLAGRPPFAAEHAVAIMTAILTEPLPDLLQFRPDTPPALTELIKHMLVKERELRLDSMRQVAAGLEVIHRATTP